MFLPDWSLDGSALKNQRFLCWSIPVRLVVRSTAEKPSSLGKVDFENAGRFQKTDEEQKAVSFRRNVRRNGKAVLHTSPAPSGGTLPKGEGFGRSRANRSHRQIIISAVLRTCNEPGDPQWCNDSRKPARLVSGCRALALPGFLRPKFCTQGPVESTDMGLWINGCQIFLHRSCG